MPILNDGIAILGSIFTPERIAAIPGSQLGRAASDLSILGKAGLKLAATGGYLVRGMFVWKDPNTAALQSFRFPMNPEELRSSIRPKYADFSPPGQNGPLYQFVNGGPRELTFTLNFFVQDRDRKAIKQYVDTLESLTRRSVQEKQYATATPPVIYFFFGELFQGERFIVTQVDTHYKSMFDPVRLLPLWAASTITLQEVTDPTTQGTPNVRFRDTIGDPHEILGRL